MQFIAVVDIVFEAYCWILIARFLLTWIPNIDYSHPIVRFIHKATDVIVRPFRGLIPAYGNVDFSPMILFLVLRLTYSLVRKLLILVLFQFMGF